MSWWLMSVIWPRTIVPGDSFYCCQSCISHAPRPPHLVAQTLRSHNLLLLAARVRLLGLLQRPLLGLWRGLLPILGAHVAESIVVAAGALGARGLLE
jgi:hypothetical protein